MQNNISAIINKESVLLGFVVSISKIERRIVQFGQNLNDAFCNKAHPNVNLMSYIDYYLMFGTIETMLSRFTSYDSNISKLDMLLLYLAKYIFIDQSYLNLVGFIRLNNSHIECLMQLILSITNS